MRTESSATAAVPAACCAIFAADPSAARTRHFAHGMRVLGRPSTALRARDARPRWRSVCNTEAPNMRIAQVAPIYEPVPPRLYGGTERIVSYVTEELVRRGHDVTLFASGDSRTAARLVPV